MSTADLIALGITPDTVLYVWSWGFASVLGMWGLGYVVGLAVGLVRKV